MQTLWIWWPKLGFRVYREGEFPPDWRESARGLYVELHASASDPGLHPHLYTSFRNAHYNSELSWQSPEAEHAYARAKNAKDFLSALDILQTFWRTGA